MRKFKWSYNLEDDILYIFDPKKKSKESIEVEEDIVIDIDKDNNLVGLEIFYAYDFFKAIDKNFSKSILNEVGNVDVDFGNYRNFVIIKLLITYNKKVIEEKLPPIPMKRYESPIIKYV